MIKGLTDEDLRNLSLLSRDMAVLCERIVMTWGLWPALRRFCSSSDANGDDIISLAVQIMGHLDARVA